MYLDYILSFQVFVTFISWVCGNSLEDLKVEYYENLITQGIRDAAKYKVRTDNSDFFQNVTGEGVINYGTFDFIIVGAGSAGSVLASRLSEIKEWKILLLEAGNDEDDFSEIPGMHTLLPSSERNWGYTTSRQKNGCQGMVNERCPYARGKILGGSGGINGLIYARGHQKDFDAWSEAGNPGWSFDELLPFFKKSENSQIPNADKFYHGFAGPLNNAYSIPDSKFINVFFDAHKRLGFEEVDYNGRQQIGVSRFQNNIKHGRRVSGGNGYVKPSLNRLNFNVTLQAFVTKLIINRQKEVEGVRFVKEGKWYVAKSTKEVIVSGGAINTPQLLMLSGVGPKNELAKHNIEIISDLPVGQIVKDHIAFTHLYFRTNYTESTKPLKRLVQDYLKGKGLFSTSFNSKAVSFMNLKNSKDDRPNMEIVMIPPSGKLGKSTAPRNYNEEIRNLVGQLNSTSDIVMSALLLNPKSVGKITLKSKSPIDFPNIDINIFDDEEDLNSLLEGIRFVQKVMETEPFQKYNATLFLPLKSCEKYEFNSNRFWYCAMKQLSFNGYHMSSTARMGPKTDPLAVVNHELKVYDVKNLRIVDCSIMPDTVRGHTNAAAFMIAEKAADLIKIEYGLRKCS